MFRVKKAHCYVLRENVVFLSYKVIFDHCCNCLLQVFLFLKKSMSLYYYSPHGIFHLSDPAGVGLIRNCVERGFHPHYEPEDGSPIYERCSHVYIDPSLKHDVIDLR